MPQKGEVVDLAVGPYHGEKQVGAYCEERRALVSCPDPVHSVVSEHVLVLEPAAHRSVFVGRNACVVGGVMGVVA